MAQQPGPLPQPSIPWVDNTGRPSLSFRQYFLAFDAAVRGIFAFFGSATFSTQSTPGTLIAVAAPSNANAANAGVSVGQLYRDTADPCKIYIRTV